MKNDKLTPLFLPAFSGVFGSWHYYSCLMKVKDLAERVNFARDIHDHQGHWSKMLQREIKEYRGGEIATYLKTEDRFFNSLVVAVYKGDAKWYSVGVQIEDDSDAINYLTERAAESVGFLCLSGEEKLYALDGQHRLLGMKAALDEGTDIGDDEIAVLMIGHEDNERGFRRVRNLFATINKKAKTIGTGSTIALDESDISAIITRKLVENDSKLFSSADIKLSAQNNLSNSDGQYLTTVGNLYNLTKTLLTTYYKFHTGENLSKALFESGMIIPDAELDGYYKWIESFFINLKAIFPDLASFLAQSPDGRVADREKLFFRPVGLNILVRLFSMLDGDIDNRFKILKKIPVDLVKSSYGRILYDPNTEKMMNSKANEGAALYLIYSILGYKLTGSQANTIKRVLAIIENKLPSDVLLPEKF